MDLYTFLDTGCTIFMWATIFLVAIGITMAAFSYYGWRAIWEIPKRIFLALVGWLVADLIKAMCLAAIVIPFFVLHYFFTGVL